MKRGDSPVNEGKSGTNGKNLSSHLCDHKGFMIRPAGNLISQWSDAGGLLPSPPLQMYV